MQKGSEESTEARREIAAFLATLPRIMTDQELAVKEEEAGFDTEELVYDYDGDTEKSLTASPEKAWSVDGSSAAASPNKTKPNSYDADNEASAPASPEKNFPAPAAPVAICNIEDDIAAMIREMAEGGLAFSWFGGFTEPATDSAPAP